MASDWELLDHFAAGKDQEAFGELVQRHVNMVYGVARRKRGGAGRDAEDVVQAVFLLLSQKAGRIPRKGALAGWLFQATRYCCADVKKKEARRRRHEREAGMRRQEVLAAVEKLRPVLDAALERLGEKERQAILVRYLEGKSVTETGEQLGISTAAVEKRLERGMVKLRAILTRQGYVIPAASVAAVMIAESAKAAPMALAASAAGVTGGASTTAAGIAKGAWVMMKLTMAKTAAAVACIVVILGVGAGVMVQAKTKEAGVKVAVAETQAATMTAKAAATTVKAQVDAEKLLDAALQTIAQQQKALKNFTASGLMKHEELDVKRGKWDLWEQDVTVANELVGVKRWRLDCRHEITPWIDGAEPFHIESYLQVYDGQAALRLDPPDGTVIVPKCWVTAGRPYPIEYTSATGWFWSVFGWRGQMQIQRTPVADPEYFGWLEFIERERKLAGFHVEALRVDRKDYLEIIAPVQDWHGDFLCEWHFWLDTKRNCALARVEEYHFRWEWVSKREGPRLFQSLEAVVTDFTEPGAGLFYPKHVDVRMYSSAPGKHETVVARTKVDISSMTVNDESVKDDTFKLELPEGTNAFDDFGGDVVVISGTAEDKEKQLAEVEERVVRHVEKEKAAATQRLSAGAGNQAATKPNAAN